MPKIPQYEGSQQISPGSGQELQSAREAASQGYGGAIANFGESVEAFGLQQMKEDSAVEAALIRQKEAKQKTTDDLTKERFEQGAVEAAIMARTNAYKNTDPAGELLVPSFNKEYDDWIKKNLKGLPNDQLKFGIENKLFEIRNQYNGSLSQDATKMFEQNAVKGYEDALNHRSARVRRNPLEYDKNIAEYNELILNSSLNNTSKASAMKIAREEMARDAIGGLTDTGDYEVAKRVTVSKFGSVFDQAEREKILKNIDSQEEQATKQSLQMATLNEKKHEKLLKLEQRATFEELVGVIDEFNAAGDSEKMLPGEAMAEMRKIATKKVAEGSLTSTDFNAIMKMTTDSVKPDQELVATGLYDKFANTTSLKDLETLQDDVAREFMNGNINKDTSVPLLGLIRTAKNQARNSKSKTSVDKYNQKLLSDGLTAIDRVTNSDFIANKLDKDRLAVEGRAARADMLFNFYKGDKKTQGNAEASFQKTMRKFFPEKVNGKIPYLPQEFQNLDNISDEQKYNEEVKRLSDEVKRKLESKELTKSEALESLRTIDLKVKMKRSSQNIEKEKK